MRAQRNALKLFGILAAFVAVAATGAAGQEPAEVVIAECLEQLDMVEEECSCAVDMAAETLTDRQMAYLAVRITENWDEILRMREFMGFLERITIVGIVSEAVTICTDGAVTELPF